jgi:NAD(P)-dependent dehydrogenase (short-subunit alcohol dehydrogenase family)
MGPEFTGTVALVTGASSGIGATARQLDHGSDDPGVLSLSRSGGVIRGGARGTSATESLQLLSLAASGDLDSRSGHPPVGRGQMEGAGHRASQRSRD